MPVSIIAEPETLHRPVTADIVAVHDFFETSVQSHQDVDANFSWLRTLLPFQSLNCRVLLYEYDVQKLLLPGRGSDHGLLSQASVLLNELAIERSDPGTSVRPLIFICHGFGGILLKRALALSYEPNPTNKRLSAICYATYAVIFAGTPHRGIHASALNVLYPTKYTYPSQLILDLVSGAEVLEDVNDHFAPLVGRLRIFNFWEQQESICNNFSAYVVREASAAPIAFTAERCGIYSDHANILNFSSATSPGYKVVFDAIRSCVAECGAVIEARLAPPTNFEHNASHDGRNVTNGGHDFHQNVISGGKAHFGDVYHFHSEQVPHSMEEIEQYKRSRVHASRPVSRDSSGINEWYTVKRSSSYQFTGRKMQTQILEENLGDHDSLVGRDSHQIVVIYGLGGSGKTQFCLRYAERHRSVYWGVFWIDASSRSNAESGYASLGLEVGKVATFSAGRHWLSQRKRPWLLILDNADDPDLNISELLPTGRYGHILITTRNPNAIIYANAGSFRFRGMDPEEGIELLLKSAFPSGQPDQPDPSQRSIAGDIAAELGYLAIALDQAGATIRQKIYTLERYLYSYLGYRHQILRSPMPVVTLEANVVTTWEIPFRQIEGRRNTGYKDAVALMHIFAFLHFESISEKIFHASWISGEEVDGTANEFLQLTSARFEEAQARLRRAVCILSDYSIIEYDDQRNTCSLHPVVHRWARARLTDKNLQAYWLHCTLNLLTRCISPFLEASGRNFRRSLLPHIDSCLELLRSQNPTFPQSHKMADQVERLASVYAENGRWKPALLLHLKVVEYRKKHLGKANRNTLRAQRNVAEIHWNLFEIKSAIDVQRQLLYANWWSRQSLRDWLQPMRPDHVNYCIALDDLTRSLWLAGLKDLSKRTGERAVDGFLKRLGPEDPLTLNAMFNLARTYHHMREFEKSHSLLVLVLRKRKALFGPNHPDTLMVKNELGISLCARKKHLSVAEKLVTGVLETRKRILGEEHAYTLWSINDLTRILNERGHPEKSVQLLEDLIPVVERTLGHKHVGMHMTKGNLARAYFRCQRWSDAEPLLKEMLGLIDEEHPDWVESMQGYVRILIELGRLVEADTGCAKIMKKLQNTVGTGVQVSSMSNVQELQGEIKKRRTESREHRQEEA